MTSNELRKLSRKELLEILLEQSVTLDRIQVELEDAKVQLQKRHIDMNQAGTMAEAALILNGVFEAADNAAKQYLDNIKQISESQAEKSAQIESETEKRCEKIIEEAKDKAQAILMQAEMESGKKRKAADDYLRAATQSAKELLENVQARAFGEK